MCHMNLENLEVELDLTSFRYPLLTETLGTESTHKKL
jgi:hypothetical protein